MVRVKWVANLELEVYQVIQLIEVYQVFSLKMVDIKQRTNRKLDNVCWLIQLKIVEVQQSAQMQIIVA